MARIIDMLAGVVNITWATAALGNVRDRLSNGAGKYTSGGAEESNGGDDELGEEHDCRNVMRDVDMKGAGSWRGLWDEGNDLNSLNRSHFIHSGYEFPPTHHGHPPARPRMVFVRHLRNEKKSDGLGPDSTYPEPPRAREVEEGCKQFVKLSTCPPPAAPSPVATDTNLSGADPTSLPACVSSY